MFGWNGIVAMVHDRPGAVESYVAFAALAAATCVLVMSACRPGQEERANGFARTWLLLTIATILLDPHFYLQDTILLAPPAIAVVAGVRPHIRPPLAAGYLAGWALLAFGTFPNQHLHVNAFGLYLVVACVVLAARMHARPAAERLQVVPALA